jgi:S1-C subfamily serine protease
MLLDTTPLVLGDRLHYIGYPSFDWVHFGVFEGLYGGLEGGEGTTGIDGERDIMFSSQTDGGASGSPLMNGEGKVVGIVVSSFRFTQYSYAEPIKCVVDLLND